MSTGKPNIPSFARNSPKKQYLIDIYICKNVNKWENSNMTNSQEKRLQEAVRGYIERNLKESKFLREDIVDGMIKHIFGVLKKANTARKDQKMAILDKELKNIPQKTKDLVARMKAYEKKRQAKKRQLVNRKR